MEEEASDILFQFVLYKGCKGGLIWRNSIYCRQQDFDPSALEFTKEGEKIFRYVAGKTPSIRVMLDMTNSWTVKLTKTRILKPSMSIGFHEQEK